MKKIKILFTIGLAIGLFGFTACSDSSEEKLYVLNWGEYLNPDLVEAFEKEFNVDVVYEEVDSNEAMYTKILANTTKYDIAFPSEYMVEKMKKENLLNKIDKSIVVNTSDIDNKYFELTKFDSEGDYFVPYFTGSIGIMYNIDLVDEADLTGWDVLWNEKYKNQVYLYDSVRDTVSIGALKNGFSINTTNADELKIIEEDLKNLNKNARAYGTDDLKNLVSAGDGAMAVVYNGDYIVSYLDQMDTYGDVNTKYYVPSQGTNVWLDGIVIPNTSQNQELANKFINFIMEFDNAFENADWVGYTPTKSSVLEKFTSTDDELYKIEAYQLPNEIYLNSEYYIDLGKDGNQIYNELFMRIKN